MIETSQIGTNALPLITVQTIAVPGAWDTQVRAINAQGVIVGEVYSGDKGYKAFVGTPSLISAQAWRRLTVLVERTRDDGAPVGLHRARDEWLTEARGHLRAAGGQEEFRPNAGEVNPAAGRIPAARLLGPRALRRGVS